MLINSILLAVFVTGQSLLFVDPPLIHPTYFPTPPPSVVSSQCSGGIPSSEVKGILDAHNKLRSAISTGNYVAKGKAMPAAKTPIANLTWDCSIENSAQTVADTCLFEHSNTEFGENLYSSWSSKKMTLTGQGVAASQNWENEFQLYGWSDVKFTDALFKSGVGHATQMAWADSTQIGCGMKLCDGDNEVITVCQYNPAGNYEEENVYEPL